MRKLPVIAAGVAVAAGIGVAMTLPAGAAVVSQSSPPVAAVQIQSPGVLVAKGAAVDVSVLVVCAPSQFSQLTLSLTQRVGSEIASGSGYQEVTCNGSLQIVHVTVNANNKAFRKAPAVASADLIVCDFSCREVSDQRTIALTNKS